MTILRASTIGAVLTLALTLGAAPIPRFDLRIAFDRAEIVVIGRVSSVTVVGPNLVAIGQQQVQGRDKKAVVTVEEQLKGPVVPQEVTVTYGLPDAPSGVADIVPGTRLLFLNVAGAQYGVADRYYPSLPARRTTEGHAATALDRAAIAIASVVRDPDAAPAEKVVALSALEGAPYPSALNIIRTATSDANIVVQIGALVDLVEAGDASALQQTSLVLRRSHQNVPNYLLHNVTYAISVGRFDSASVDTLALLLTSQETETRRAAAQALWHMVDPAAKKSLASALADSDREVRYYAVRGLAALANQPEWEPSIPEFDGNEQRYLQHWKEWVAEPS